MAITPKLKPHFSFFNTIGTQAWSTWWFKVQVRLKKDGMRYPRDKKHLR